MIKKYACLCLLLLAAFLILGATFIHNPPPPATEKIDDSISIFDRGPNEKITPPAVKKRTPCVENLMFDISPSAIKAGDEITVSASFTNCSDKTESYDIVFTIIKNAKQLLIGKTTLILGAGEEASIELERTTSPLTPTGMYGVMVGVYDVYKDGTLLGSEDATLQISAPD